MFRNVCAIGLTPVESHTTASPSIVAELTGNAHLAEVTVQRWNTLVRQKWGSQ